MLVRRPTPATEAAGAARETEFAAQAEEREKRRLARWGEHKLEIVEEALPSLTEKRDAIEAAHTTVLAALVGDHQGGVNFVYLMCHVSTCSNHCQHVAYFYKLAL